MLQHDSCSLCKSLETSMFKANWSAFYHLRLNMFTYTKIWFINGVDNVNWPPYRDWKNDVSSPSSELWRRATNASAFQCTVVDLHYLHCKFPALRSSLVMFERISVVEDQTVHHFLFATFNAGNYQILLRAIWIVCCDHRQGSRSVALRPKERLRKILATNPPSNFM